METRRESKFMGKPQSLPIVVSYALDFSPFAIPMPLPDFQSASVLVVGDLMLDRYWHGSSTRISPEAPVPIVHVKECEERCLAGRAMSP